LLVFPEFAVECRHSGGANVKALIIAVLLLAAVPSAAAPATAPRVNRAEQACFADLQRFCPGRDGFTANACLQANFSALSDMCRAALGPFGLLPGDPFGEEHRPLTSFPGSGGIVR